MRIVKTSALVLGTIALVGVALSAQDNSGNPSILAVVQSVQSTVTSIVTTLSSLVTTVNSINSTVNTINASTGEGNVLFTPSLVAFPPDTLICTVTNVSDASRNVSLQLQNGNTGAVISSATLSLNPGQTIGATGVPSAGGLRAFCRITVNNGGVKSQVRGVLALFSASNGSDKDPVAAF